MLDIAKTAGLLVLSNIFMTFAWYAHLKHVKHDPSQQTWLALGAAVLMSWGIAFFEYLIQVPANRIGYGSGANLSLAQLKVMQEVITLCVFVPFAVFYMRDTQTPLKDYLLAGLCLLGAVYFIFRSRGETDPSPPAPTVQTRAAHEERVES